METDIRGFTALTENLSPRETIKLINEYIETQAEIIIMEEYNGSIDKYMGDAVLVIFEGEDKERRAYECAHHIQHSLRQLNKRKRRQARKSGATYQEVEIGIGLSMGRVIMGNMGCAQRMEHTVIGSTVNLAARLCSASKGGEIVIHQAILEHIGKQGQYEEIQVKGFSAPVPVRRLSKADTTSNLTYCRGIHPISNSSSSDEGDA
jgi:adenylate cyclase